MDLITITQYKYIMQQNTRNQTTSSIVSSAYLLQNQVKFNKLMLKQEDAIIFKHYREVLQKQGIRFMENSVCHYFQCELLSASILEEYQEWVVRLGFVEVGLKVFVGDFGKFQMEFQRSLFQLNGWDYQVFPTEPTMIRQDIRKAAAHKIVRILLQSQQKQHQLTFKKLNKKQQKSPKFDLIWDRRYTTKLIPSINVPITQVKNTIPITETNKKFYLIPNHPQYTQIYKEIETKMLKLINFLTIQQVMSILSFVVVEEIEEIKDIEERMEQCKQNNPNDRDEGNKIRLYITWCQYNNCFLFNYQSQIIQNILNPYTNLVLVQVSKGQYQCLTAKYPKVEASKLKIFGFERALSLLADFYINKSYDVVYQLYDGDHDKLVYENKGLLINLLTTLYYENQYKNYINYRSFMGKSSGIIPEPKTSLLQQSPLLPRKKSTKQQKLENRSSNKKQMSDRRYIRQIQKISEYSMDFDHQGINSDGSFSSENQIGEHNEEEKQAFSDQGENNMFTPLRQKNQSQSGPYILGEQHEYLFTAKQKKYSSSTYPKTQRKYDYNTSNQQKKQFNSLFSRTLGDHNSLNFYYNIKKHKNYYILNEDGTIEYFTLKQIGSFLLTQPIENLILFSRYYLILINQLGQNECEKVDVKLCEIFLQKMIQNYFVEIENFITGSKNQQQSQQDTIWLEQKCQYKINYLNQAWYLLNELLLIALRYQINNLVEFWKNVGEKRKKLSEYSQNIIKNCQQKLKNAKNQKQQLCTQPTVIKNPSLQSPQDFQDAITLFSAYTINSNLVLIFLANHRKQIPLPASQSIILQKTIQLYNFNFVYKQLIACGNPSLSEPFLIKTYIYMIDLFMIDYRIYLSKKFHIINHHIRILDHQLLKQIHQTYGLINILTPKHLYQKLANPHQEGLQKLQQNILLLTCINNFYIDKFSEESSQKSIQQSKNIFIQWLNILSVSKMTIKWLCKTKGILSPLFDPAKPRIYKLLTLYTQLYHIPNYLQQYCLVQFQSNYKSNTIMQKLENCLDSFKEHIRINHPNKQYINLNIYSDQYILGQLVVLAGGNYKFFQYRQEIQEITIQIIKNVVQNDNNDDDREVCSFVCILVKIIMKFRQVTKILEFILKYSYRVLKNFKQFITEITATNPKYLREFDALQQQYQHLEQTLPFTDDIDFLELLDWYKKDKNIKGYYKFKVFLSYFMVTNYYFYYFQAKNKDFQVYLNVMYNELKGLELISCQVQCMSIKILCQKLKVELKSTPLVSQKSIRDQSRLVKTLYSRNKNKINQNLPLLIILLNKLIQDGKNQWTTIYEQAYNSAVLSKNNFDSSLNQYAYQLSNSYIDRLLVDDGACFKNSQSLYLIAIEFLRYRKLEDVKIEKQFRLLELACKVFHKNNSKMSLLRRKYLCGVLNFISAKLYSVKFLRKSKKNYEKLNQYHKNYFLNFMKILPTPNVYHRIHRLYEKFERQGNYRNNSRKIYKSLCSKCGHVINKDIRPKRVLIGLMNRVQKIELILGLQQKI